MKPFMSPKWHLWYHQKATSVSWIRFWIMYHFLTTKSGITVRKSPQCESWVIFDYKSKASFVSKMTSLVSSKSNYRIAREVFDEVPISHDNLQKNTHCFASKLKYSHFSMPIIELFFSKKSYQNYRVFYGIVNLLYYFITKTKPFLSPKWRLWYHQKATSVSRVKFVSKKRGKGMGWDGRYKILQK